MWWWPPSWFVQHSIDVGQSLSRLHGKLDSLQEQIEQLQHDLNQLLAMLVGGDGPTKES